MEESAATRASVASISDAQLLERAVRHAKVRARGTYPRWVAVMEAFGLGATFATQLCERFGLDPDEQVK